MSVRVGASSLQGFEPAGIPRDEAQRLKALRSLGLLDSTPSEAFDSLTRLAAHLLQVPIALVTLVDEHRQWFKSRVGSSVTETSRDVSFCSHAVFHRKPLIVPDATIDARFAANPLVTGDPYIRAYLGIPIFSRERCAIGTLCAIDTEVRAFTDAEVRQLADCAKILEELIHSQEIAQGKDSILRLATEREQRFQCLVQLTSQIIWTNNADGRMGGEQSSWGTFTGQSFDEYQGFGWATAVHPDDAQPTIDEWNRCVAAKSPFVFEHRVRRYDGMYRICSVDAAPILNEDGTIREWVGIHHDITERRQQEERISAQEAHFRALADAVPQMVWTARPDGTADYYNQQWFAYTGMTRQQADCGEWATIHPDDTQNSQRAWNHSVATGASYEVEQRFKRSTDGAYRWHLCRAVRLLNDQGRTIKWFGTCTDIHDYKEAEAKNLALRAELEDRVADRTAELEAANKGLNCTSIQLARSNASLKASEEFLDRAGQIGGIGAWSYDLQTRAIRWSNQTCLIHEVPIGHVPSLLEVLGYYTPEHRVVIQAAHRKCIETSTGYDLELTVITAKGRAIWVRIAGEVEIQQGKAIRIFGVIQDITARKAAASDQLRQHELMRVTLESIGDAVITTDAQGAVQWLNPVAARITGWPIDEARGKPIDHVMCIMSDGPSKPGSKPTLPALTDVCAAGVQGQSILRSRDGAEYGIQHSAAPIMGSEGRPLGIVVVFQDVSEQRRLANEVHFRASHDALTGLVNRSEFELILKQSLASARDEGRNHALLFIDLDQFKLVNDACGHSVGDQLLRQVATIFMNVVRARDTLARLGGDEFGVILKDCTAIHAQQIAAKLCESMENFRFTHDDQRFRIGASIGLVSIDSRWIDVGTLMQAADTSCYAAKEAGRNRVHEWVETDERRKERQWEMQWISRLDEALDENRFQLYAQRIESCSAETTGLSIEILLRLARADGSIIAPSAFLPAAERFHMASRIDRWVVREVVRWMASHGLNGIDSIAVNLSGQSIGDRSFHRYVAELMSSVTFDLHKLCFEITETAAITNMGDASEFINSMRGLGIRIALDDFGSGAASFGYLKHLRVDILKIDGQFVRDLLHDRLDHTAVCCFRDVAAVMGLKTVAEFVESKEVLTELRRIGIDFAQGYLIHRPEPLDNVIAEHTVIEVSADPKVA